MIPLPFGIDPDCLLDAAGAKMVGTGCQPFCRSRHLIRQDLRRSDSAAGNEATLSDSWPIRPDEDWPDVTLARGGDQQAFERLYRRHVPRVRGLARRLAGVDVADGLTQDAFVLAWEKLRTFRGDARFATWLHRLAVNLIIENRRRDARRARYWIDDADAVEDASTQASDGVFAIDFAAAVDHLPEGARHVFVLHDVEGYKHHEIAALLGIAVGTSKGQLFRARLMLRRGLTTPAAEPRGSNGLQAKRGTGT